MKAKYLSMAAIALMGTLASCQSDDDFTVARPADAVSVNFSVGSLQATTRSNAIATDDTQRQFNADDQIAVSTPDQEAVVFQCTSTEDQTWAEAETNKFLLWTTDQLQFSAYYPVTDGTSMTTFTLPADQSSVAKINAADYMTATQLISRPTGGSDIQMQLQRQMARVIVKVAGFGDQYSSSQKTIYGYFRIGSQASGIADSNPTGGRKEITPYQQGNGGVGTTYTALVVPGTGNSGQNFITFRDGTSSSLSVRGIPALEAGKSYTFNLTVGKNTIKVQSVTVQDWTTGETLSGGQAEEQTGPTTKTVTWNNSDISVNSGTKSFTKDGVTMNVTGQICDPSDKNFSAGTFTSTVGNFTKIEVTASQLDNMGSGWSVSGGKATWTGTASSTVSFGGSNMMDGIWGMGNGVTIVFTIEE